MKNVFSSLLLICSLIFISCNPVNLNSSVAESKLDPTIVPQYKQTTVQVVATGTAVSLHTSTLAPSPTHTQVPTETSTPPATPTAKVLLLTPNPHEPQCPRPPDLEETEVDVLATPFCIVWIDKFDDETGFRIVLEYARSGESFIYEVGQDTTQLVVPEADAPRLNESLEQCLQRKDWQISVNALRAGSEHSVGKMAVIVECGGVNGGTLPTATP